MSLSRHSRIAHHLKTPLTLEQICGIVEELFSIVGENID